MNLEIIKGNYQTAIDTYFKLNNKKPAKDDLERIQNDNLYKGIKNNLIDYYYFTLDKKEYSECFIDLKTNELIWIFMKSNCFSKLNEILDNYDELIINYPSYFRKERYEELINNLNEAKINYKIENKNKIILTSSNK